MFRRLAANSTNGNPFDFSPLGEVRQLRFNKMSGAWWRLRSGSHSGHQRFGVGLYVFFTDAAAWACALDFVNIHTDFASQTPRAWRCGNWLTVLGSGNL